MSGVLGGLAGSSKGILNVQSLIVGGGGGAGTAVGNFTYTGTGGGGGGAHRSVTALDVRLFTNYTVTVGAGGTNRANGNSSSFQGASLPLGGYGSQGGGGGGEYSAPKPLTVPLVVVEVLQAVLVVLLFLDKDLSEETLAALPLVEVVELVVLEEMVQETLLELQV
jgi:hypothetical protein